MILGIGLMVGCYIITRMVDLIFTKKKETHVLATICAVGTICVTLLVLIDLVLTGANSSLLNYIKN